MPVEITQGSRLQVSINLLRQFQKAIAAGSDHVVIDEATVADESGYVNLTVSVEDPDSARAWSEARATERAYAEPQQTQDFRDA